jgi:NmrA-like family
MVVQAHMQALALPITVLRPMAFMELMTDKAFFPPVAMWHVMPKLTGADRPIPWLCVDDLGAITAKAFADPDRFIGADLKLVADIRSNAECREIWREVTGRKPRKFPMPTWLFERFAGTDLSAMWRWLQSNDTNTDQTQTRSILPTALTVQEWLWPFARAVTDAFHPLASSDAAGGDQRITTECSLWQAATNCKPSDYGKSERWTRAGFERGTRFRKGER